MQRERKRGYKIISCKSLFYQVAKDGIEPQTQGFSVRETVRLVFSCHHLPKSYGVSYQHSIKVITFELQMTYNFTRWVVFLNVCFVPKADTQL